MLHTVSDMEQVEFLQFVPSLQELTLRGNPVCDASDTFREGVFALLTSLELLDDEPKEGFGEFASLSGLGGDDDGLDDALDDDKDFLKDFENPSSSSSSVAANSSSSIGDTKGAKEETPSSSVPPMMSPRKEGKQPSTPPGSSSKQQISSPRRLPGTPSGSDIFGPRDEAKAREEKLVSRGIKEAEVGRIFDVSADGRQMLTSASRAGSRPATAIAAWGAGSGGAGTSTAGSDNSLSSSYVERRLGTAIGSLSSRPTSASSRPLSALSRPVSSMMSRPSTSSRLSSARLSSAYSLPGNSTTHETLEDQAESTTSELTASQDIICGVHKLRAHKLRRDVNAMRPPSADDAADGGASATGSDSAAPTGGGAASREPRPLEEELMDQLRAVKIQQLLAGDEDGPSDESDDAGGLLGYDDDGLLPDDPNYGLPDGIEGLPPVEETSLDNGELLMIDSPNAPPPAEEEAASAEAKDHHRLGGLDAVEEALDIGDEPDASSSSAASAVPRMMNRPSSSRESSRKPPSSAASMKSTGSSRPSSSTDVTPTHTPSVGSGMVGGTSSVPGPIGPPKPPPGKDGKGKDGGKEKLSAPSPGRKVKEVSAAGKDGQSVARMQGGAMRHLRMPDERGLADAAAEILYHRK